MNEFHAPMRRGGRDDADDQSSAMRLIAGEGRGRARGEIGGTAPGIRRARPRVPHWTLIGVIGLIVGDRFITSAG